MAERWRARVVKEHVMPLIDVFGLPFVAGVMRVVGGLEVHVADGDSRELVVLHARLWVGLDVRNPFWWVDVGGCTSRPIAARVERILGDSVMHDHRDVVLFLLHVHRLRSLFTYCSMYKALTGIFSRPCLRNVHLRSENPSPVRVAEQCMVSFERGLNCLD